MPLESWIIPLIVHAWKCCLLLMKIWIFKICRLFGYVLSWALNCPRSPYNMDSTVFRFILLWYFLKLLWIHKRHRLQNSSHGCRTFTSENYSLLYNCHSRNAKKTEEKQNTGRLSCYRRCTHKDLLITITIF